MSLIKGQDSFMGPVFVCSNERVLKLRVIKLQRSSACVDMSSSEYEAEQN